MTDLVHFSNDEGFKSVATPEAVLRATAMVMSEDAQGVSHCSCCSLNDRVLKRMLEGLACSRPEGNC